MFIVRSSFAYPSLNLRSGRLVSVLFVYRLYRINGEEHFLFLVTFIKKGLCDTLFFSIFAYYSTVILKCLK